MVSIYFIEYSKIPTIYVGSSINPQKRLLEHASGGTQIGDCKKKNGELKMTVLDIVPLEERLYWERFYIDLLKMYGFTLKNKHKIHDVIKKRYPKTKNN